MRALLLVAALALAPAVSAQDAASADDQSVAIGFSLEVTVAATDAPVPPAVRALADDGHLAQLDLSRSSSLREQIRAEFVFESMADYVAWRESDRVVALLAELEAAGQGLGLATALTLRRYPLANWVRDRG